MNPAYIHSYNYQLPDSFEEKSISENRKGRFGTLAVSKEHSLYPDKSDAKIMRTDVISSIIVINELLNMSDVSDLENISLYVANGAFMEENNRHIKRMMKTFQKVIDLEDQSERLKYVYKSIPPLTALETLTNSTMSFIAKYTGIKGLNTTFGNTSYGGFSALSTAIEDLNFKKVNHVLFGGANGSGIYSALAHHNFYENNNDWIESTASSFVLLSKNKNRAIAKIVKTENDSRVPSLSGTQLESNWHSFFDSPVEMVIYSGGFTKHEFNKNEKKVKSICENHFSWNHEYGNLGAASIPMNLIKAVELIKSGKYQKIDILDRDPYGRESYFQITKTK